jgi:hypothetical protein
MILKKIGLYCLPLLLLNASIISTEKDIIIEDNATIIDTIIANNAQIMYEVSIGSDVVIDGIVFANDNINVSGDANVNGTVYIDGDNIVSGNQIMDGTLFAEEINISNVVANDASFCNVFVGCDLEVATSGTISGDISVAGNQTLDGTLFVGGDIITNGNVTAPSVFGQTVDIATAIPVFVDETGAIGTSLSSKRFKENIKSADLKRIFDLIDKINIVSFNYKSDTNKREQIGMIAEQMAEVFPEFVAYDNEGKPFSIRYDLLSVLAIGAMSQMKSILNDQDIRIERLEMLINSLMPAM